MHPETVLAILSPPVMSDTAAQSIALSLGISALVTVACRRIKIPALLPLLAVGLALGTSGLDVVSAASLGTALTGFITVAIGLLIFEGALHLNAKELGRAPRAVWGLLTIGAIITWAGASAAAHYVLLMSWPISVLLGAALIVTGPTVVQPILRLVRVSPRLHSALAAEAVLIDPIGVVATIATLEVLRLYILSGPQLSLASEGLWLFAKPLVGGAGVGVLMGLVGYWLLKMLGRAGKPDSQMLNLVAVGVCMTCVGLGEVMTPEAGLAAVTICGVVMARAGGLGITELRSFKELLAVILVGTLFVLLASRFDVAELSTLSWREGAFVLILLFVVRPVAVWLSTWRSKLAFGERVFAGTFAPRGIVALSVMAVASAELGHVLNGIDAPPSSAALDRLIDDSGRLELIMFVVIAGTVLLASTYSPLVAWLLRVRAGEGSGVLLIGGHPLSVGLAKVLTAHGLEARIIDSNEPRVSRALKSQVDALLGDATDSRWMDDVGAPHGTGWVIAWTGNHDVDQMVARWSDDRLGVGRVGIWSSKPARGPLERADMSGGESITEWSDRPELGGASVAQAEDPSKLRRVLGWIQDERFQLNLPRAKIPAANGKIVFVGLAAAPGPA